MHTLLTLTPTGRTTMNTARKLGLAAALTLAALTLAAPAHAAPAHCTDITQTTGTNYGILNGTQIAVPIDLDLDVSHNALGILGLANTNGGDRSTVHCGY